MKRFFLTFLVAFMVTGCSSNKSAMDQVLSLRDAILRGNGCSFQTVITADYGDALYSFEMKCTADKEGNLTFEVLKPDSIAGVSGTVSRNEGKLTFDDQALLFETLADGQITPVSAPWIMVYSLRGGYIQGCARQERGLFFQIDDSYEDKALTIEYYTDENNFPTRAEVIWQGRRIVSMDVEDFVIV